MASIRATFPGMRRALPAFALFMIMTIVSGCGTSDQSGQFASAGSKPLVKQEDFFRYEGKGKNKQKVTLSRSERRKLVFDAKKKLEAE